MKNYPFGKMAKLDLPLPMTSKIEVMHFTGSGTPHSHDRTEVAICVTGHGWVWTDDSQEYVEPGEYVEIPPGVDHWMEPKSDVMTMVIGYYTGRYLRAEK